MKKGETEIPSPWMALMATVIVSAAFISWELYGDDLGSDGTAAPCVERKSDGLAVLVYTAAVSSGGAFWTEDVAVPIGSAVGTFGQERLVELKETSENTWRATFRSEVSRREGVLVLHACGP
jgi:hypothetical protein